MSLPSDDRLWLGKQGIAFRDEQRDNQRCLIFVGLALPPGKFDVDKADILTLLPPNYPDAGPDMFYARPRLVLANGQLANATNVSETFLGETWQRWSRHWNSNTWRAGIDDIQTVFRRIKRALDEAA